MNKEEKLKQRATSYGIYIGSKSLSKVEIIEQLTEFAKSPEVAQYHQQSEAGDVEALKEQFRQLTNEFTGGNEVHSEIFLSRLIKACVPHLKQPAGSEWVSVKDRLPEEQNTQLIVYTGNKPGGVTACATFLDGKFFNLEWYENQVDDEANITNLVSHWMPLPPIPTIKNNEG